ncbi:MAG TPA: hypothetical protein VFE05_11665, partial [Longimicrobiaceae bacterium]|nr:hypothetical protein [Longimicrobiaceae bacterium]
DPETAERAAKARWHAGDAGRPVSGECCELESVHALPAPCDAECSADCEAALRFLRDRELVIENLDDDAFNPTVHDAISAEEVAQHFGWTYEGPGGSQTDVPRAARALDRLCSDRRVVCFTRPRVRRTERGEIRLYCTPQHLERLSALLEEDAVVA